MLGTPRDIIAKLHDICGDVLHQSLSEEREAALSERYVLLDQLQIWSEVLAHRSENRIFVTAQSAFKSAMLNACQGQYRNSFKNLRLTLELYLQGIFLSSDEISLREWLANNKDTNWSLIVDPEKGVFSPRFVGAFFPSLDDRRKNFETMSRTLYRELSECTHGNTPRSILISDDIVFSIHGFETFLSKCDTIKMIINFSLCMRYLCDLKGSDSNKLEGFVLEELGHISAIRSYLGGAV